MITIIDPHIKIDNEYQVSQQAKDRDLFVKGKDGSSYSGWCWPGNSNWLDYTNPAARDFWAQQFLFDTYKGSSPTLYTWNDMNEVRFKQFDVLMKKAICLFWTRDYNA